MATNRPYGEFYSVSPEYTWTHPRILSDNSREKEHTVQYDHKQRSAAFTMQLRQLCAKPCIGIARAFSNPLNVCSAFVSRLIKYPPAPLLGVVSTTPFIHNRFIFLSCVMI
jgi:hypothetical protein